MSSGRFAQESEARANLFGKELRLFPGRKVPARDLDLVTCFDLLHDGGAREIFKGSRERAHRENGNHVGEME
jgi:hypothetical protein